MKRNYVFMLLLTAYLTSCDHKATETASEDKVQAVANKDGAIETEFTTEHLPTGSDVIVTKHRIWNNNLLTKEVIYRDTVRGLGKMPKTSATDTSDVNKDYEFYITVK